MCKQFILQHWSFQLHEDNAQLRKQIEDLKAKRLQDAERYVREISEIVLLKSVIIIIAEFVLKFLTDCLYILTLCHLPLAD